MLLTLSFFALKSIAEAFRAETGWRDQPLDAMAKTIRQVFPEVVGE